MKDEYVQLAQTYSPTKHFIAGWLMSEKLDGFRCIWDGGITRGMRADSIPWANTAKDKSIRYAGGLWTRYGKVISAPKWWLDQLPDIPLDGELWCGLDDRQGLASAVKKHTPIDAQWKKVKYMVFDSPSPEQWLKNRSISNQHNNITIPKHAIQWYYDHDGHEGLGLDVHTFGMFSTQPGIMELATQHKLPMMTSEVNKAISDMLARVIAKGGEGLMFRNPRTQWLPERTYDLLKYKPFDDCEVTVVGFSWGKVTDKESRNLGRMGALRVQDAAGHTFLVSGYNDAERVITYNNLLPIEIRYAPNDEFQPYGSWQWGVEHAGKIEEDTKAWQPKMFPIGKIITVKHRGRTKDGIPVEARYWRDYVG